MFRKSEMGWNRMCIRMLVSRACSMAEDPGLSDMRRVIIRR